MSSNQPPHQTPAGWYPGENGQERYWSGTEWTNQTRPTGPPTGPPSSSPQQGYYQPGPPPRKSHTLRNALLIFLALGILFIGGCMALIGGAANEVDKALKEEEANDKPRDVVAGKAFEHDGYKVAGGWKVARSGFGTVTIKGLRVTNETNDEMTGEGGRVALLTFRFYKGSENLAEVTCDGKELQEGESSRMDCSSGDGFPKRYETIRVADLF